MLCAAWALLLFWLLLTVNSMSRTVAWLSSVQHSPLLFILIIIILLFVRSIPFFVFTCTSAACAHPRPRHSAPSAIPFRKQYPPKILTMGAWALFSLCCCACYNSGALLLFLLSKRMKFSLFSFVIILKFLFKNGKEWCCQQCELKVSRFDDPLLSFLSPYKAKLVGRVYIRTKGVWF